MSRRTAREETRRDRRRPGERQRPRRSRSRQRSQRRRGQRRDQRRSRWRRYRRRSAANGIASVAGYDDVVAGGDGDEGYIIGDHSWLAESTVISGDAGNDLYLCGACKTPTWRRRECGPPQLATGRSANDAILAGDGADELHGDNFADGDGIDSRTVATSRRWEPDAEQPSAANRSPVCPNRWCAHGTRRLLRSRGMIFRADGFRPEARQAPRTPHRGRHSASWLRRPERLSTKAS